MMAKQKQSTIICYNNNQLSFTLKDGIEALHANDPSFTKSLLRHYTGGIITSWYEKLTLITHTLPTDWYAWHGAKLNIDYPLMDETWLTDIVIIAKALDIQTLIKHTKQAYPLHYHANIKQLGTTAVWLEPNSKTTLS